MGEQGMASGKRLTRGYEPAHDMGGVTDPDWRQFRAQLFTELAPRSLRDRLLVEAIETIAERAFYAGQEVGLHLGAATTRDDTLAWLAEVRAQHAGGAARGALVALEALILGACAHDEVIASD